jgi:excisionase family DNA binding protein
MTANELPLVLSVPQLAELLAVNRNAAYRLVADGEIFSRRIGRSIRIPTSAAIAYIEGRPQPSRRSELVRVS